MSDVRCQMSLFLRGGGASDVRCSMSDRGRPMSDVCQMLDVRCLVSDVSVWCRSSSSAFRPRLYNNKPQTTNNNNNDHNNDHNNNHNNKTTTTINYLPNKNKTKQKTRQNNNKQKTATTDHSVPASTAPRLRCSSTSAFRCRLCCQVRPGKSR